MNIRTHAVFYVQRYKTPSLDSSSFRTNFVKICSQNIFIAWMGTLTEFSWFWADNLKLSWRWNRPYAKSKRHPWMLESTRLPEWSENPATRLGLEFTQLRSLQQDGSKSLSSRGSHLGQLPCSNKRADLQTQSSWPVWLTPLVLKASPSAWAAHTKPDAVCCSVPNVEGVNNWSIILEDYGLLFAVRGQVARWEKIRFDEKFGIWMLGFLKTGEDECLSYLILTKNCLGFAHAFFTNQKVYPSL